MEAFLAKLEGGIQFMADYTAVTWQYNKGSEGTPDWTGAAMASGGSGNGLNEMRFADTGAGAGNIASASWPLMNRPASASTVKEAWIYTSSDNSGGVKVATYPTVPSTNNNGRVFRISFSNDGSPVTTMNLTAYADSNHSQPVLGQQTTGTGAGGPIINGQVTDTSNTAYLKGQVYGNGLDSSNNQQTPGANSLTVAITATDGTNGAVSPSGAAWITAPWQSMQGNLQYIAQSAVIASKVAFFWYVSLVLYTGPNMLTGYMTFVINLSYNFA
jgi:hypothetical protein